VWLVLDCFDALLDPLLAPLDLVELLARWVGLPLDRNWSPAQTRRLVATAVELYRRRGTRQGLADLVRAYTGVDPVITDSGGATWTEEPGGPAPGTSVATVHILVELPEQSNADLAQLTRLIAANVPAHVEPSVDVRRRSDLPPVVETDEPSSRARPDESATP
jgi:phage tail-like protein